MATPWKRELPVPESVAAGRAQSIPPLATPLHVQVMDGAVQWDGTVSLQVSLDGVNFVDVGNAGLVGMTGVQIPKASLEVVSEYARWIRANTTVYASGKASIILSATEE